jgi:hypothetical protein
VTQNDLEYQLQIGLNLEPQYMLSRFSDPNKACWPFGFQMFCNKTSPTFQHCFGTMLQCCPTQVENESQRVKWNILAPHGSTFPSALFQGCLIFVKYTQANPKSVDKSIAVGRHTWANRTQSCLCPINSGYRLANSNSDVHLFVVKWFLSSSYFHLLVCCSLILLVHPDKIEFTTFHC